MSPIPRMISRCCNSRAVFLAAFIVTTLVYQAEGYKHVVFMHGILAGPSEFDYFINLVQEYHPGTPTTVVNLYNYADSVVNIWEQVGNISEFLLPILTNKSSEGSILICFSQGGLICRGLLSTIEHNVETFVSLSSPLAGQYGDTDYLRRLFPNYLKKNIFKLFYSTSGQKFSVANYWNDPHEQELFRNFSTFLAVLNNQSTEGNPRSYEFRNNFLRLKNLVLVGGPDDGVITPWQSSQFGMYNSSEVVLPMEEQEWYQNDAFGLKTMNSCGSIYMKTVPGIPHLKWHSEQLVFDSIIKPVLT
uniref:palmitoyl-CoA hydrolase n=1 Tax=Arion vulgaris TaxID=1028688 RepID=A0A0B6YR02_9EUPU